jgi:hypothetical protein
MRATHAWINLLDLYSFDLKESLRMAPRCRNILAINIRQDAMSHSLYYLETALHVSGGNSTHHQERKQLYLQHLVFVRPLLLPAAIAAGSCRYSCLRS